ncbi:MAG TPA: hypothetical protein VF490_22025 [Chryseosolibacter sp.]
MKTNQSLPNRVEDRDTEQLNPVGKMKGEINGGFESFYIAVDREGQLFINHDPEYSEDRYKKSNGWKPITRQQLEAYEGDLRFFPSQRKSLRM